MSYYAPAFLQPQFKGLAAYGADPASTSTVVTYKSEDLPWWIPLAVLGVLGVIGAGMYFRYKMYSQIVAKEGAMEALKFEAGETALGALSQLARPSYRNNRRGRRSRRR